MPLAWMCRCHTPSLSDPNGPAWAHGRCGGENCGFRLIFRAHFDLLCYYGIMIVYIVEALRSSDREMHSYILGVWDSLESAKRAAEEHVSYRGGKYGCQVHQCHMNSEVDSDWCSSLLYEMPSAHNTSSDVGGADPVEV